MMAGWTEDRIDALKKLWSDGLSASEIARKLGGLTRNAVIGKAYRLNLPAKVSGTIPRWKGHEKAAPKPKAPKPRPVAPANIVRPEPRPRPKPEAPVSAPTCDPVRLADHRIGQCAFVVGAVRGPDTLYCGAPSEITESWCRYHQQVGYNPEARRSRKKEIDPKSWNGYRSRHLETGFV